MQTAQSLTFKKLAEDTVEVVLFIFLDVLTFHEFLREGEVKP